MFETFKNWLIVKLGGTLVADKPLWPLLSSEEYYCLGLLTEEGGEISQEVGKALRFGPDTKNPKDGTTPRQRLSIECGDMQAAIDFNLDHGILDEETMENARVRKIDKLRDPVNSKDNLGRPLAPQPKQD